MGVLRWLFGGPVTPATREIIATMLVPDRDEAVVDVVGESNYQPGLERLAGGRTENGVVNRDHVAVLAREPGNRWDRNAIRVEIDATVVGYLDRERAMAYRPVLDALQANGKYLACNARLTGGWLRPGDQGTIGVILHLGSPAECMLDLLDLGAGARSDHRWAGQVVAFTGDSTCRVSGYLLDRPSSVAIAEKAGMIVHPRVTKKVQLLVDCDRTSASGNELKAREYGIPIVDELEFWAELGIAAARSTWSRGG